MAECAIPECGKTSYARGWCKAHYSRWQRHGDPMWRFPSACSVADCESSCRCRGLCEKHYRAWKKWGDPLFVGRIGGVLSASPSYAAVHDRLRKSRGGAATHACVDCGGQARDWSYMGGAPDEMVDPRSGLTYSTDPDFYEPRCRDCHARLDGVVAKSWAVRKQ